MKSAAELEKLINDALEPYAKERGLILHSWNDLHVALTYLYLAVCQFDYQNDEERDLLLAIWNAVPVDRMQRSMLKNAAGVRFSRLEKRMEDLGTIIGPIKANERKIHAEIIWILDSADKLGRKRDDAAHLPMILAADTMMFDVDTSTGHPIAQLLDGKDVLSEFNLYRARMDVVRDHAWKMWSYLVSGEPLPERPAWPSAPPSQDSGSKGQ